MTSTQTIKEEKEFEANTTHQPVAYDSSETEHAASMKEQKVDEPASRSSFQEKQLGDDVVKSENNDVAAEAEDESQYLSGVKLYLVMLGLGLACLLVGLVSCVAPRFLVTLRPRHFTVSWRTQISMFCSILSHSSWPIGLDLFSCGSSNRD